MSSENQLPTIRWTGGVDGRLVLLDQTELPTAVKFVECSDVAGVVEAITSLRVRGAPAIGIAAAYGVVLGMQEAAGGPPEYFQERLRAAIRMLAGTRPTAVNLRWALDRMERRANETISTGRQGELARILLAEAEAMHAEDRRIGREIGRHGAALLADPCAVLTHCNAGALATTDFGTALGVVYAAVAEGKRVHVWVDETRPLLQGARLTAWELAQHNVPCTLICDSMAGAVMRQGRVQAVLVGADRIAANGDTANKIGTYSLAVLARAHCIPFYVAAPTSTFDLSLADGGGIPIEVRRPEEITHGFGRQTAPVGTSAYNPAFDVTPAGLISAIVSERGVIQPVETARIAAMLRESSPTGASTEPAEAPSRPPTDKRVS
jgi:methylthioribose-1-phosphate isomerase